MKQYGYVTEVLDDKVKIRVIRESSCGGNCVSCKGCPTDAVMVECVTDEAFSAGEKVTLIMKDKAFYNGLFWGYGQVILLTVILAVLGYVIFKTELASVLGAALGLCLGLTLAKLIFRNRKSEIKVEKAD